MSGAWDRLTAAASKIVLLGLAGLPPEVAREACAKVAALYAVFGGPRVADARVNLALAFPERSPAERERILVESFANLGRSFAEVALLYAGRAQEHFHLVSIEGRENLERVGAGVGALVLTAHLGSWEFCAAALADRGFPVSVVQHGFENRGIDSLATGWRERAGLETLSLGGAALGVFRALARGRYVALLLDQNASEEEGVYAPFFARPACTRSGPAQLAMTRGTPVIPVFFHRVGSSGAHVAKIGQPITIEPEGDDSRKALEINVARMNAAIEAAIRESPSQWIWTHRRFKTQPAGTSSPYPPRSGALRRLRHSLRATG